MQVIISKDKKIKFLQGSMDLVKHSFFTDDLVKAGSFICLQSSERNCFNAVCYADCQNDVNPNDEFLLSISNENGVIKETRQPRLKVIGYAQQYFSGNSAWQEEIEWNR